MFFETRCTYLSRYTPVRARLKLEFDYTSVSYFCDFLANVNSCSRSLYAIALPSVVCLSVVCNVRAPYTQTIHIFRNISMALGTLAIH